MAIVIVGMLDEREDALGMIKERIEEGSSDRAVDVSVGTGAIVPTLTADVGFKEVLGLPWAQRGLRERSETAVARMAVGLDERSRLFTVREVEGIIAITGMTGAIISLAAMKALPFGFPSS